MAYKLGGACNKGHCLSEDNVYIQPSNGRVHCRMCRRVMQQARDAKFPEKKRQNSRNWYRKNKLRAKEINFGRLYGITLEEFEDLFAAQEYKCAICKTEPKKPCVDHDHRTGKVRGVLCSGCNSALGALGDNLSGLLRAVEYLAKGEARLFP